VASEISIRLPESSPIGVTTFLKCYYLFEVTVLKEDSANADWKTKQIVPRERKTTHPTFKRVNREAGFDFASRRERLKGGKRLHRPNSHAVKKLKSDLTSGHTLCESDSFAQVNR
jgi:hypothetical protein